MGLDFRLLSSYSIYSMNSDHHKFTQMQEKLNEGLQTLIEASETDRRLLGVALIQTHGAMEDFVRLQLAMQVPKLRAEVEDVKQSTWKTLIVYSKQYLGFNETDADTIMAANAQRNDFAHGGKNSWKRDDVVRYAQYVFRKSSPGQPLPDLTHRKPASPTTPRAAGGTAGSTQWTTASTPIPSPNTQKPPGSPGRTLSRTLGFLIAILCLCSLAGISYTFDLFNFGGKPPATRQAIIATSLEVNPPPMRQDTPRLPASLPGTEMACVIVWVEHTSELLAARNRSMVWVEIVKEQVLGSGMTDRQFFDQVVEKNPDLETDGYVFREGKTYLLPKCK